MVLKVFTQVLQIIVSFFCPYFSVEITLSVQISLIS